MGWDLSLEIESIESKDKSSGFAGDIESALKTKHVSKTPCPSKSYLHTKCENRKLNSFEVTGKIQC